MDGLRLGFVGAGNMATAILDGVINKNLFSPIDVMVSNPHADKLEYPKSMGVQTTCNNSDVVKFADLIVLAVKPQMYDTVLTEISGVSFGKCFISIAAGISTSWIGNRLPGASIVRVMPNTPLQLGLGATAIAKNFDVSEELFEVVCNIFSAAGVISVISESQMDAIIPVSGSSPAFFFRMADTMVKWANEQGIDAETALELLAATMKGSAEMLLKSGKTADELVRQVCSPGGTTLAALTAFDDFNFDDMLNEAMSRCVKRSRELGR